MSFSFSMLFFYFDLNFSPRIPSSFEEVQAFVLKIRNAREHFPDPGKSRINRRVELLRPGIPQLDLS